MALMQAGKQFIRRFVTQGASFSIGETYRHGNMRIEVEPGMRTLYSYAMPIARVFVLGKALWVTAERSTRTTNHHINRVFAENSMGLDSKYQHELTSERLPQTYEEAVVAHDEYASKQP